MNLNWKEIDRILEELDLVGAQIQDCVQVDIHSIYLQCYKGREIWVHMHLNQPFVCICEGDRPKKPKIAQRFQSFLLSNIKNAYITDLKQYGKDRIVMLTCSKRKRILQCFIPLWAGKGNVIVCDASMHIIEACLRKPKQGIAAGNTYVLPESSQKLEEKSIREHDPPLARFVSRQLSELITEKRSQEQLQRQELLAHELSRLNSLLQKKEKQIPSTENITTLRHRAELFLNARSSWHSGMEIISVHDYETGDTVSIPLQVDASFKKNADSLFLQAKKLHSRQKNIAEQIAGLEQEIALCTQALENPEDPSLREYIHKKNISKQSPAPSTQQAKTPQQGRHYVIEGFPVYVGRNARQNELLIRKIARGNDVWLHARDYPGAHVIVKKRSKTEAIPHHILLSAAKLALYFSKGKKNIKGDVYTCAVKHLRKKRHGVFGEYIPHQEKNLFVSIEGIETLLAASHNSDVQNK